MFCHIANSSLIHLSRMSQAHKEQKNMSGKVAGLDPLMVRVAGLQMIWSLKDQRDLKMSSELSSVFHLDFSHLSLHIPSPPLVAHGFPPLPWLHHCVAFFWWDRDTSHRRIATDARRSFSTFSHRLVTAMSPCRRVAIRAPRLCTSLKTTAICRIVHWGWLRLVVTTLFWS